MTPTHIGEGHLLYSLYQFEGPSPAQRYHSQFKTVNRLLGASVPPLLPGLKMAACTSTTAFRLPRGTLASRFRLHGNAPSRSQERAGGGRRCPNTGAREPHRQSVLETVGSPSSGSCWWFWQPLLVLLLLPNGLLYQTFF